MAKDKRTWHEDIQEVLKNFPEGLNYGEIVDEISRRGLREKIPSSARNMVSKLVNVSLKDKGEKSPYKRVAPATFALKSLARSKSAKSEEKSEGKTWHEAIKEVLEDCFPEGLHTTDVVEEVRKRELRTDFGKNPRLTVESAILTSIKDKGSDSPYERVEGSPSTFRLKDPVKGAKRSQKPDKVEADKGVEESQGLINSFGMFWERDRIDWDKSSPKIYGVQIEGADKVDFYEQVGVYILYDRHRPIYVGCSIDALGKRLRDHTKGRLRGRWDRFSWFGIFKVSESGKSDLDKEVSFSNDKGVVVATLESLLIDIIEPPQNRQRENFSGAEYLQVEDSEFIEKKNKQLLASKLFSK